MDKPNPRTLIGSGKVEEIAALCADNEVELVVFDEELAPSQIRNLVSEATGLKIDKLMSGEQGGEQQIASRISYNEIDVLLYFRDTRPMNPHIAVENELLRMCDLYNVPVATNIATAEVIITALERGDLDWRELLKPHHTAGK